MNRVVVVGGGIAALETVMALRALAGERVGITLVAPEEEFVLRALLAAEPFGAAAAPRLRLRDVAADFGAEFVSGRVRSVDHAGHGVVLSGGDTLAYDTLVLAPGAQFTPAFDDVITLGDDTGNRALEAMLDELAAGDVKTAAFVALTTIGWHLPLYEAALMTARRVAERGRLFLVTPERKPLDMFGAASSKLVAGRLEAAGITFVGHQQSDVADGVLRLPGHPLGELAIDRIVSLPLIRGPRLEGVPADAVYGFIPVDAHGRVDGLKGVYAAGDATSHPVKQGALAARQALAVAEDIAQRSGAPVRPAPYVAAPRGLLLTGDGETVAVGDDLEGWDPTKLPGRHLAPYLLANASTTA